MFSSGRQKQQPEKNEMPAYDENPWLTRRDNYRTNYTFTDTFPIRATCRIGVQDLMLHKDQPCRGMFYSFGHLIVDSERVKEHIEKIVGTYHSVDKKLDLPFYIDRVGVSNIRSENDSLFSIGMSVELPYVKHTNTSPYRVVSHVGDNCRFRAVDEFTFQFHNGQLQQAILPVNVQPVETFDILSLDVNLCSTLQAPTDGEGGPKFLDPPPVDVQKNRMSMMHMLDVLDNQNCYPEGEPRKSQTYIQRDGMKTHIHIQAASYPASWFPHISTEELAKIGATVDGEEYMAIVHTFFSSFSQCRLADWERAGLYITLDMVRQVHEIYFEIEMEVRFIVKKNQNFAQDAHCAIQEARKFMETAADATNPFEKNS